MKKQCIAIKNNGQRCRANAQIGNLCMSHYLVWYNKKNKITNKRRSIFRE